MFIYLFYRVLHVLMENGHLTLCLFANQENENCTIFKGNFTYRYTPR